MKIQVGYLLWAIFIKAGGKFFEGMYEWVNEADEEYWDVLTALTINNNTISGINEEKYLPTLQSLIKDIYSTHTDIRWFTIVKENNKYVYYTINQNEGTSICGITDSNSPFNNFAVCLCYNNPYGTRFELNLENSSYTETQIQLQDVGVYSGSTRQYGYLVNITEFVAMGHGDTLRFDFNIANLTNSSSPTLYTGELTYGHTSFLTWHHVKTEFTLEHPYQLLPNINALGKHGDVVGDGSIYQHINLNQLLPKYVYLNGTFLMSSSTDISKKNFEIVDYSTNFDNFNTTPTISQRKWIVDMNDETYTPIVCRRYDNYAFILCDDNNIRIYYDDELFTTVTINSIFDYTSTKLCLVPTISGNKLCFAIFNFSKTANVTTKMCVGYVDISTKIPTIYYNNSAVAYYPYWDTDAIYVGLIYKNNHIYTVLPNYHIDGKVYEDGVLKCTLPVNTTSTGNIYYPVMADDGIYYYEDNRLYGLKNYDYYIYGDTSANVYSLPITDQYTGKCIGLDQNRTVYLQVYNRDNNYHKLYTIENGSTLNLIFDYGTIRVNMEHSKMDIIRNGDKLLITDANSTVQIVDISAGIAVNGSRLTLPNTYSFIGCNNTRELYTPIIEDKTVSFIITRPDIKILNDKSVLLDLLPTSPVNNKLYMKI